MEPMSDSSGDSVSHRVSAAKPANRCYRGIRIVLAVGLMVYGGYMLAAAHHMGKFYANLHSNPLEAFRENAKAVEIFPLDHRFRRQLQLALAHLVVTAYPRVRLTPEASDRVYRISASAGPNDAGMLLRRAELLVNFGRAHEAPPVLDRLNRYHPYLLKNIRIVPK